jgi:N-acetylglucosaminyl-diphospho-decaprenol L-rhamnosyltransferase
MMEFGSVTASIVSHGQGRMVAALLGDLAKTAPGALGRLVVTLNVPESEPDPVPALPFDLVVIRNPAPIGFGANHNGAFQRYCTTPWFAVLNPDLRLSADPFDPLLRAAAPGDVLLAPRIVEPDGSTADSLRRLPTPFSLAQRLLGWREPVSERNFDWVAGMFLMLRSDAFRALGGFDERYFLYCEDTDLSMRIRLDGGGLKHVDSVCVMHDPQRQSHRSLRYLGWHVASLARLWTSARYWRYLARRRAMRLSWAGQSTD